MSLKWNNITIPDTYNIKFNEVSVNKIYFDGVLVWQKSTSSNEGYIECQFCYGTGWSPCLLCDKGVCTECWGEGSVSVTCPHCIDGNCEVCNGSGGHYEEVYELCPTCQGSWHWYICNACGTDISTFDTYTDRFGRTVRTLTGKVTNCGRCGSNVTGSSGAVDVPCPDCGAMGHTGKIEKYHIDCENCNGRGGPCTKCGGIHSWATSCTNCKGTGFCQHCDQTGLAMCERCNGTGKLKPIYDASSGNVTIPLKNGKYLELFTEQDSHTYDEVWWNFSADFDLQVVTLGDNGLTHWGYQTVSEEILQFAEAVYIIDFNGYENSFYSNEVLGDPQNEGEYIHAFGETIATLSFDITANTWTVL